MGLTRCGEGCIYRASPRLEEDRLFGTGFALGMRWWCVPGGCFRGCPVAALDVNRNSIADCERGFRDEMNV